MEIPTTDQNSPQANPPSLGGNLSNGNPSPVSIVDNSFPKGDQGDYWSKWYDNYKANEKDYNFYKGTQDANAAISQSEADASNPLSANSIKGTIANLPGTFSQVLSKGFTSPKGAFDLSYGMGKSLLHVADVVPMLSNYIGSKIGANSNLPLPGQTLIDWLDSHPNVKGDDTDQAIQNVSSQVMGYELGGKALEGLGAGPGILKNMAGFVLGGQLGLNSNTSASNRAKQAMFDAAFGAVTGVGGKVFGSLRAGKIISQAVEDSKGVTMNNAIEAFKNPESPMANPEVAQKLQSFMDTKGFDNSKNLLDFESKMKSYMGDTIKDPKVADQLQQFIQDGKMNFNDAISKVKGATPVDTSVPTKLAGPTKFGDVLKDDFPQRAEAKANVKPPETKYVPKDDLGVDENGEKRLATTNYDHKTGNAIVNYDKSLDSNPQAKQIVLDHENGHILDKRLNGGDNFSTELLGQNPQGANVEKVMNDFAKNNSMSPEEATVKLGNDIKGLTDAKTPSNEKFAEAVSQYKADPEGVAKKAPTFAAFMEHVPNEGQFSEHTTTLEGLKDQSPMAGHQVDKALKEAPKVETPKNVMNVNGKQYELKGDSLKKFQDAKTQFDKDMKFANDMKARDPERAAKRSKAAGMEFAAAKRQITGALTDTEIRNATRYEQSNYLGKKVDVEINGEKVSGEVVSKSSFGNVKVKLEDGTEVSVKNDKITDPRSASEIQNKITAREGVKDYSPSGKTVEKPVDSVEKPVKTEQPIPKEAAPSSKIADTGLDTGKRVTDRSSFNADKMNTSKDVEVLLNKLDAENKNFGDQRVSKSNADLKDLARVVGLTPDELAAAKPGSIANSETILQARQLVLNQAEKVSNLTKELNLKTASDVQLQGLRDEFLKLVALQKGVAGFRTEASNALRSFGIELAPDENITLRQLLSVLKQAGVASNDDAALFAEKAANEFKMTTKQRVGQGLLKTWYASILSGPATPIRHGLSVGSNIITDIASKAANPKTWNEVIPASSAFFKSLGDGWDTFKETLRGKLPEPEQFQALENVKEPIFTGKFAGYGKIVEGVGRFMDAAAAGYTKIAENVEKASLEVGSKEMSQEVTDAMTKDYGDFINYRGEPRGAITRALMKGVTATTKEAPILKVFMPFVKTVSNVLDRQFDYMPGTSYWRLNENFLGRQADQIMNKFDLTSEADRTAILGRLHDQQVGRAVLGTTIATAGFIAASKGLISGAGPANYNKKLQLEQSGWRANSIKIGDTWVPYIYLGPLGGVLSMVGNMSDAVQYNNAKSADLSSSLVKGIVGFTKSQLDRSFLKGVSDLFNVLSDRTDPGKYLTQLGTGLIPIPKLLTSTTQEIRSTMSAITGDPTYSQQYETRNIVDAIRAKLGLQGDVFGTMKPLEPKLDAFGRPMTSDIIYGVTPKNTTGDKVDVFLNSNDLVVTRPLENAKYTIPGTKTQTTLTPEEYTNYLQDSGKQIYEKIASSIKWMAHSPPDEQKKEIQYIVSTIRTDVRDQILLDRNKK